MAIAKRLARARARAARRALDGAGRAVRARAICRHLATITEVRHCPVLAGFAPLPEEANIWKIATDTIKSGRAYCLPRVLGPGQPLAMHKISAGPQELTTGYGGILEPALDLPRIPLEQIAVALVPSVSVDQEGNRLGFGQGFYDITISHMPKALLIAPLFTCQLLAGWPVAEHDRPMDIIVTEDQVLDLRPR